MRGWLERDRNASFGSPASRRADFSPSAEAARRTRLCTIVGRTAARGNRAAIMDRGRERFPRASGLQEIMTDSPSGRWQFWIDRGGTFTDIVARRPDGTLTTHKLLSENPERYRDAAVAGIRALLGVPAGAPVNAEAVDTVRMGTTVATNALLERKGERTVLAITRGFADALRIASQTRPKLFVRRIVLPSLLYERVIEIDERVGAHGEVVRELDLTHAERNLRAASS